jgi:hypothetical protein
VGTVEPRAALPPRKDAVDFAYAAVEEAESAVLDAIQARAAADDPETAQRLASA